MLTTGTAPENHQPGKMQMTKILTEKQVNAEIDRRNRATVRKQNARRREDAARAKRNAKLGLSPSGFPLKKTS